jgi:hypothetical protein
MNTINLELSRKELDPAVLVPEDATLDEMNELSEKLKRQINKNDQQE